MISAADGHGALDTDQTQHAPFSDTSARRRIIPTLRRLLICTMLGVLMLRSPPVANGDIITTSSNIHLKCDDSGLNITFERLLDSWIFDIKTHRPALEKLGQMNKLRNLKSSHADVGGRLSGIIHLMPRLHCALREYASHGSEAARFNLIKESSFLNIMLEALLQQMLALQSHYDSAMWLYSALNRTAADLDDANRVGMPRLLYLYHEPLLLRAVLKTFGQNLMDSWWNPWIRRNAMQEAVHLGSTTCQAELESLEIVYEKIAMLDFNIARISQELSPEVNLWEKIVKYSQSLSKDEKKRRAAKVRERQEYWRE